MNEENLRDYLSRLLNRDVTVDTSIVLSSGQRARFLSWLEHSEGYSHESRLVASREFTVRQFLSVAGKDAASAPNPRRLAEVPVGVEAQPAGLFAGIGIDIQKVAEIVPYGDAFDFRSSADLSAIFSPREISYACSRASPTQTLAGLFAAKEAVIKADSSKASCDLYEIEILPNQAGVPSHEGFQVSISHSGEYAVAMAVRVSARPASGVQSVVPLESGTDIDKTIVTPTAVPGTGARGFRRLSWLFVLALVAAAAGGFYLRDLQVGLR